MDRLYHSFGQLHPTVGFFYFLLVFVSCFLSRSPVMLLICLFSGLLYLCVMKGIGAALRSLAMALPMAFFLFLINPLFNHNGVTPLFYINDTPFTLEAAVYGVLTALAITDTLLWFRISNDTFDHDKSVYLFGRAFPTAALMIGMIFRTTSYLQKELQRIRYAQNGLGVITHKGRLTARVKNAAALFLCLTGNALEHSVDTAVAMRSRGYGLQGRSRRQQYRFRTKDGAVLLLFLLLAGALGVFFFYGVFAFEVIPALDVLEWGWVQITGYLLYGLFLNIPLLYNGKEALKWQYLHWKM